MLRYVLARLPTALLTIVLASVAIFGLVQLLPGSPAAMVLGDQASAESVAELEAQMGLDRPLVTQYLSWIGGLLTGDLGTSYVTRLPINDQVIPAIGATLELTAVSLLVTVIIGLALGIAGATLRRSPARAMHKAITGIAFGTPEYVVGIVLVFIFAVTLRVLPSGGREDGLEYLILPVVALSVHSAVVVGRFLETALNEQLDEDYLDTARAKGVSRHRLLWRHALPNALPSVVTVVGLRVGHLLGGAVVIEVIFSWPGLGLLLTRAVSSRDYLLVQDLVLMSVVIFIVVQLVTDLVNSALDPRVRLEA